MQNPGRELRLTGCNRDPLKSRLTRTDQRASRLGERNRLRSGRFSDPIRLTRERACVKSKERSESVEKGRPGGEGSLDRLRAHTSEPVFAAPGLERWEAPVGFGPTGDGPKAPHPFSDDGKKNPSIISRSRSLVSSTERRAVLGSGSNVSKTPARSSGSQKAPT